MLLIYAVRRLVAALPVLVIVAVLTFLLMSIVPGDPARVLLGDSASTEQLARLRTELGLDDPWLVRFGSWFGGVLRGDLGESVFLSEPVSSIIGKRGLVSLTLAIAAEAVAIVIGIVLGVVAALRRDRWLDRMLSAGSVAGIAVPNFVVAILLIALFAVQLRWLPATGFVAPWDDLGASIRTLALPVAALAIKQAALIARMMRGSMVEVLSSEYLLAARARGLGRVRRVVRHALPNALGPTITVIGVGFGSLVTGTVIIEVVFGIPGMGQLLIDGVRTRDIVLLQGVMLTITAIYVLVMLLTDLAQAWVNPRIKPN
ncbi:ABC transporter permease [Jiangella mangrovi]|uniref:Peptide/nickel transport system permease protein n=1 Tax=Jiangella mangrovi TaxID=1524084 RepID=A0A7W9GSC4_9ACTN|nr:ABC transporter permease [Jiangella mangrovi]MBB5788836.1 peptide/nickel transport system permease protein [Jiangella mangrovi]